MIMGYILNIVAIVFCLVAALTAKGKGAVAFFIFLVALNAIALVLRYLGMVPVITVGLG